MWIKRFQADDMDGALAQVRDELGSDALILSTRKVRREGVWGWLGRQSVEITAAVEKEPADTQEREQLPQAESENGATNRFLQEMEKVFPAKDEPKHKAAAVIEAEQHRGAEVNRTGRRQDEQQQGQPAQRQRQLAELRQRAQKQRKTSPSVSPKDLNGSQPANNAVPGAAASLHTAAQLVARSRLYNTLTNRGVEQGLARKLVNEAALATADQAGSAAEITAAARRKLLSLITKRLGFPEPLPATPGEEPIVAMLVGPTGAGKTTNLAKLAARYALEYEWEVEIVAADAYRVGAVEHLTQYAGLMGVTIRSAQNPGELRRRVNNSEADLVLVDSAGRNHRDDARMVDLDDLVHAAQPDYVFLCVSLTSREEYTLEVINRYRHIGFNRLFFTKLDETEQFGSCLNIAAHTGTALSYISKGQRVPEDLVEANAHELAARLLEVNNDE